MDPVFAFIDRAGQGVAGTAWLFLCILTVLQAVRDRPRRTAWSLLACIESAGVLFPVLRPVLPAATLDLIFAIASVAYVVGWPLLCGEEPRRAWRGGGAYLLLALGCWWALPTHYALGAATGTATLLGVRTFGRLFLRSGGYAAAVILARHAGFVASYALCYGPVMATNDPRVVGAGHAVAGSLQLLTCLFGWVHLPRELAGRVPVCVERRDVGWFLLATVGGTVLGGAGALRAAAGTPWVSLAGTALIALAMVAFHLRYRSLLVAYGVSLERILEERTGDLAAARDRLARHNEELAGRVRARELELVAQTEGAERQRRLEIAARAAGESAHDIQNLLAPVFAHAGALERSARGREAVREAAGRIRAHGEALLEANGQLLALARRGRVDRLPLRVDELLEGCRTRFAGRPVRIDAGPDLWVRGSWAQLSRATDNLVRNALDSGAPVGEAVRVACVGEPVPAGRRMPLGVLRPGLHARLTVTDRGRGLSPESLARLLEPAPGAASGRAGIGWLVVAAVLDDHEGAAGIESGPGGTTVSVWLPTVPAPAPATGCHGGTERILLVDDDADARSEYGSVLSQAGYSVLTAPDGLSALHIVRETAIDALVLDLKMPRRGGLETFQGALHLRPGIRAVAHSRYVEDGEARQLREWGVPLLQKPASRNELLFALREALDLRPARAGDAHG